MIYVIVDKSKPYPWPMLGVDGSWVVPGELGADVVVFARPTDAGRALTVGGSVLPIEEPPRQARMPMPHAAWAEYDRLVSVSNAVDARPGATIAEKLAATEAFDAQGFVAEALGPRPTNAPMPEVTLEERMRALLADFEHAAKSYQRSADDDRGRPLLRVRDESRADVYRSVSRSISEALAAHGTKVPR